MSAAQQFADVMPLAAYVCTDEGAELARAVVERTGQDGNALRGGGLSGAARLSTDKPVARTLLTEIGNISASMACESVAEIRKTGADVIVLGHQGDIDTYRALRKVGALEYFAFPVAPDEILDLLSASPANDPGTIAVAETATCIGVVGSNGGVGASLLARNLGYLAARAKGPAQRTALIDADLRFGSQAIDLDRDETPGLFEALSAPDRIDATFLGATMTALNDRLALYSQQARAGQDIGRLEAGLPHMVAALRAQFETLVLDLPRATAVEGPDLCAALDSLIVVIPCGYGGVNAACHIIERVRAEVPELTILPVLSELRRDAGLSGKDMARAIGQDIAAVLPRCDSQVTKAHRAARPMIECQPRAPYAKAADRLLRLALARPANGAKPARKPFLKRMFA